MLEQEVAYFEAHRDELLEQYRDRFVLVKGGELVGVFNSLDEALIEGVRRFGLTSFLARQVTASEQAITAPALTLGILHGNP